jgi:hypothetical protein
MTNLSVNRVQNLQINAVNEYLRRGCLELFDANTSVNQCHLVTLQVCALYEQSRQRRELSQDELEILKDCMFLNSVATKSNKGIQKILQHVLQKYPLLASSKREREQIRQQGLKAIESIVCELNQNCLQASLVERIYLNLKKNIVGLSVEREVDTLLKNREELIVKIHGNPTFRKKQKTIMQIPTLPKYVGVQCFLAIQTQMQSAPPIVLKVKHCCRYGMHLITYYAQNIVSRLSYEIDVRRIDLDRAAIVVEGVCLSKNVSYEEYEKIRNVCSSQLLTKEGTKTHDESSRCIVCRPCYNEKCLKVISQDVLNTSLREIILKVGAAFNRTYQEALLTPSRRYCPEIYQLFESSLKQAQAEGYSYDSPTTYVIEHIHPNTVYRALSLEGRLLDEKRTFHLAQIINENPDTSKIVKETIYVPSLGQAPLKVHDIIAQYVGRLI